MTKTPICEYCNEEVSLLQTDNHLIGCKLEAIADVLRYRGYVEEAHKLDDVASKIK